MFELHLKRPLMIWIEKIFSCIQDAPLLAIVLLWTQNNQKLLLQHYEVIAMLFEKKLAQAL